MKKKMLIKTFIIAGVLVSGCARSVQPEPVIETKMVTARKNKLLRRYDKTKKLYKKMENREIKIASYFHRRKIGEAIVEKDFIRYQFNTQSGQLIEQKKQWRSGLPEKVTPAISRKKAESMVEGSVTSSKLFFISPESDVFPVKPTPKNPCWIVWSRNGKRQIATIIDAITGEKLGYGIPPPYTGFSLSGPDWGSCDPSWTAFAQNAETWFKAMGYDTEMVDCPTDAKVQSHIQSDSTAMFYESAHGHSSSFHNECPDSHSITAGEVETWIDAYASMAFIFLGSCDGMCLQGNNNFSYEFRKGSNDGTVTVGYCGMSNHPCVEDCWPDTKDWQTILFTWMAAGHTIDYAFSRANLAYPDCAGANNCMRFAGDTGLRVVPVVTRSLCGSVYNGFKGPLSLNSRDYYIRCDIAVPTGQTLTIDPHVELVFLNDSKITSNGTLNANGSTGQIRFVSEEDNNKGIEFTGQIRIMNGGQIKIWGQDDTLKAHWKLDETEGDIAKDSTRDYDAVVYGGAVWQPVGGKINGALEFDGIDDYVSPTLIMDPADGSFSVFAWIKGGLPGQVIISQAERGGGRKPVPGSTWLGADPSDGKLITTLMDPTFGALRSEVVITDGQWYHVGLVYDFDGMKRYLYVDGVEVAKDTEAVGGVSSSTGLHLGAGQNLDPASFFSGLIDDVRIYNRAVRPW